MWYKFFRNWETRTACYVEADSLEEAKKLASEEEWEEDNDERVCTFTGYKECEDIDDIEEQDENELDYYDV